MKTACLVLAFAALACSPANVGGTTADSGADGATDAGSSAAQACKDRAYAYCTQLDTCSTTVIQFRYGNVQTCEKLIGGVCDLALAAPSTGISIAQVEACGAAEASWACNDIINGQNTPPACSQPSGPLATGSPCTVNQQCQTAWCSRPAGKTCGACAPPPSAGAPCDDGECLAPLVCSSATQTCGAYVEAGGECGAANLCDAGLSCVGGICQASVAIANMPCVSSGPGCDTFSGLACNAETGTCKTLELLEGGQACGTIANQPTLCVMGSCPRGQCVSEAALGDACDLVAGPACADSLRCIVTSDGGTGGTCQIVGSGSCP